MREEVLRDLARRAATDRGFPQRAREDLAGTLARYGYGLTGEELSAVENIRRRTAGMDDAEVVRALAGGLERRPKVPIERPATPDPRRRGPPRPTRPGSPGGR